MPSKSAASSPALSRPPTHNTLAAPQRARLLRSARKLGDVLGTPPCFDLKLDLDPQPGTLHPYSHPALPVASTSTLSLSTSSSTSKDAQREHRVRVPAHRRHGSLFTTPVSSNFPCQSWVKSAARRHLNDNESDCSDSDAESARTTHSGLFLRPSSPASSATSAASFSTRASSPASSGVKLPSLSETPLRRTPHLAGQTPPNPSTSTPKPKAKSKPKPLPAPLVLRLHAVPARAHPSLPVISPPSAALSPTPSQWTPIFPLTPSSAASSSSLSLASASLSSVASPESPLTPSPLTPSPRDAGRAPPSPISPISGSESEPPTPTTAHARALQARRRRMAKLARTFGTHVPPELVGPAPSPISRTRYSPPPPRANATSRAVPAPAASPMPWSATPRPVRVPAGGSRSRTGSWVVTEREVRVELPRRAGLEHSRDAPREAAGSAGVAPPAPEGRTRMRVVAGGGRGGSGAWAMRNGEWNHDIGEVQSRLRALRA
ncbi:hypothetical protein OBBRIDRAFT_807464 [Obba rivulosa]|uniref:Uncharacterized protein n=1 Tax=Obba rivulosa TaxID=1052685 RepID=A0A8E2APC8_9APHY|nr:hypothetical protein OBBRIDRAFT_807464 [Obba rivulosa]